MAKQQVHAVEAQAATQSDFTQLLEREFRPKTDQARAAVEHAVQTLAEQALTQSITISDDAYKSIAAIIAQIDRKLSEQINLILHHDDYQALESAWRGLNHLVSNTETDEHLKIRVMDVSKAELHRTMRRYKGLAWDQSPLFKQIYEQEYGQLGGEPYGCIVADYYFDHTPPDVDLLGSIAKVAAAAHTPFVTGAAPSVLQMESWQELANPRDLTKIFTQNLEYTAWNSLRNTEDARYVGLAMPRFLARLPYGAKTNPVDQFDFEEDTNGSDHSRYGWWVPHHDLWHELQFRDRPEAVWSRLDEAQSIALTNVGLVNDTLATLPALPDLKQLWRCSQEINQWLCVAQSEFGLACASDCVAFARHGCLLGEGFTGHPKLAPYLHEAATNPGLYAEASALLEESDWDNVIDDIEQMNRKREVS
nr:type VI secretion system contractile sheath large subunit [Burkholderia multivorans]